MSRDGGFTVMDVSTDILNDPKFRKLQRLYPDLVAPCVAAYLAVMAESWKAGRRVSIEDGWPSILPYEARAQAALEDVGLIDRRGCLPVKAWDGWFGPAQQRRKASRDRWERYNAKRNAANTPSDTQPTSLPRGNHVATATSVPSVPTDPSVPFRAGGPAPEFTQAVDFIEQRTGRPWGLRPGTRVWDTLAADLRDFGLVAVTGAMRAITDPHPDAAQLVFGASRLLHPIASANGAKPAGGHTRTAQEVEDAFSR